MDFRLLYMVSIDTSFIFSNCKNITRDKWEKFARSQYFARTSMMGQTIDWPKYWQAWQEAASNCIAKLRSEAAKCNRN